MAEFNNPYDQKGPLKSLPQELNNSSLFTTATATATAVSAPGGLFMAGPRSTSSSFSNLQLGSNFSSRFSCLHDSKDGCLQVSGSTAAALVTSATALLQKAAQIGATTSSVGGLNSPLEIPHSDQPDMVGGMNMRMYQHMMMMKEQDNCSSSSSSFVVHEKGQWRPVSGFSGGVSGGESQMMTLDLLGEGGWRLRQLQEDQSHHQQQQMVPIMKHYELHNFHGDSSSVEKSIFEF